MARTSALAVESSLRSRGPGKCLDLGDGLRLVVDHDLPSPEIPLVYGPDHLLHAGRPDARARLYQLVDGEDRVHAALALELCDQRARSPAHAPFGGHYLSPSIDWTMAERWMCAIEDELATDEGIDYVQFKLAPSSHDEALHTRLFSLLARLGYRVHSHELVHTRAFGCDEFWRGFNRGQRKNLHRARRAGLRFCLASATQRVHAHALIARTRRGCVHPLTGAADQIEDLERAFPQTQPYFLLYAGTQAVAAASCDLRAGHFLRVRHWASALGWRGPPALPLLVEGIAQWAVQAGYTGIDAGPSTLLMQPAAGLFRFKESLGFESCLQLEFSKARPPVRDTWLGLAT